jgi:uncharacterized protein DUF6459
MPSARTPDLPPAPAGLRLVQVPAGWPPYDCETHGAACPMAPPADTAGARVSRARAGARPAPMPGPASVPGAASARRAADGAAAVWPRRFAQGIVEVLAGTRPAKQLASHTTERVRAQIGLLSRSLAAGQRPTIRRVFASRPTADVVEMTVVLGFGSRSRALAMRLEYLPGRPATAGRPARPARWLCTDIETG